METLDRYRGCMLGLAIGDAYGAAYEFMHASHIEMIDDYQFCYTHGIESGYYTDDTSQTLCLAHSILECGRFDQHDFAIRLVRWYREGYLSSVEGDCFDIGMQTRQALEYYERTGDFMDTSDASLQGNGSLMRIGAVAMAFSGDDLISAATQSSAVTHSSPVCIDLCVRYAQLVRMALDGCSREEIIAASGFTAELHEIEGSGWVVHGFNVAMYSFIHTDSLFAAIQMAVGFGMDTDTNACIIGMLAGAFYGSSSFDDHLVDGLYQHEYLISVADELQRFHEIHQ